MEPFFNGVFSLFSMVRHLISFVEAHFFSIDRLSVLTGQLFHSPFHNHNHNIHKIFSSQFTRAVYLLSTAVLLVLALGLVWYEMRFASDKFILIQVPFHIQGLLAIFLNIPFFWIDPNIFSLSQALHNHSVVIRFCSIYSLFISICANFEFTPCDDRIIIYALSSLLSFCLRSNEFVCLSWGTNLINSCCSCIGMELTVIN